jgi:hypothetical protein
MKPWPYYDLTPSTKSISVEVWKGGEVRQVSYYPTVG